MMAGKKPFFLEDGRLQLCFKPILPGWLFTDEGKLSFKFLGDCLVTYHNPTRADTFAVNVYQNKIILSTKGGELFEIDGAVIPSKYAKMVRKGEVDRLDIHLK
jgi:hypothetical protein